MSGVARTAATGALGMLPELLEWSTSLEADRAFAEDDIVGSMAHVTMLGHVGLVAKGDAHAMREELRKLRDEVAQNPAWLSGEEDVHMAVEAELARRLGSRAAGLHTARSRNDQVATDERLFLRRTLADALGVLSRVLTGLCAASERGRDVLLPAYTHRQRAQPITLAFLLAAWGTDLLRAGEVVAFALSRADELPLGSGACSGTSLPIDRHLVQALLHFSRLTPNALQAVGDRGPLLDAVWGAARVLLSLSRIATDLIDYSTKEFSFVRLDGRIAAGSSMMPQKKNPDMFELLRGKSARGVADVMHVLTLMKGLPTGYNRDQQEDRASLLGLRELSSSLQVFDLAFSHVTFVRETTEAALQDGFTQATDLAEALVRNGTPFREAYKAVGGLVARAADRGCALADITEAEAAALHPGLSGEVLARVNARAAVEKKSVHGGTGAVDAQLQMLTEGAKTMAARSEERFQLSAICETVLQHSLS